MKGDGQRMNGFLLDVVVNVLEVAAIGPLPAGNAVERGRWMVGDCATVD